MATLYAIGKRTGRPLPDFKGLKFDTYVWHASKGDWVLFSLTTIDKAGAVAIATCDAVNILPIGLKENTAMAVPAATLTKINTWLANQGLSTLAAESKVGITLRTLKQTLRGMGWEKELEYEQPGDPEEVIVEPTIPK